jgi:hypothetical protein
MPQTDPYAQFVTPSSADPYAQFAQSPDDTVMRAATQPAATQTNPQTAPRPFFEAPHSAADALGPLEAAAHIVSGVGGQIVGGLAGLGAIPYNAFVRGQSLPKAVANAGNVTTGVENALTYEPRTAMGHDITNVVQYPFQKLGELANLAGGKTTDLTGSPLLGTLANTAINAAPMLVGAKGDFTAPVAKSMVPDAVANARSLGLKLTPTQAQSGVLSRVAESLSSHAKLERNLSRQNAQAVDTAAGNAVGVSGPVTAQALQAAKDPHNAVYDEVGAVGNIPTDAAYRQALSGVQAPGAASFPGAAPTAMDSLRAAFDVPSFNAADAVAMTRQLRADAGKNIKAPFDPERNALGFSQRNISDALESQIERHLQNNAASASKGSPEFTQWFGASKVVGPDGKPLTLYHGTDRNFSELQRGQKSDFNYGDASDSGGIFLTDSPQYASSFSSNGANNLGARVMPLYARIENPAHINPGFSLAEQAKQLHDAEAAGHDGAILGNGEYVVFHPDQIKSAIGNRDALIRKSVDPTLVTRFQAARKSLAKIHSVEDALKAGKGQAVSAANLGKQLRKGAPLSGNLRTIAESAERFPRAFQDLDKIRNSGPLSMLPTYGGGLLTVAHPAAWPALAGAVLGPPSLRALLGSERFQRAAFDPRIPQTAVRPGLRKLGVAAALSGQDSEAAMAPFLNRLAGSQ